MDMVRAIQAAVVWADMIVCALIRTVWVLLLVAAAVILEIWRGKRWLR